METFGVMTIKEFAKMIKKPASTIYEWRRKELLPNYCFKIVGKSIFVRIPEMLEFFNK